MIDCTWGLTEATGLPILLIGVPFPMMSMFDLEKNASMEHCFPGICEDVVMSGDFIELAMATGCLTAGRRICWLTAALAEVGLDSGADDGSVSNGSFIHTCE